MGSRVMVQVFQRLVFGPPEREEGSRAGKELGLFRRMIQPGELVAVNFAVGLEMVGNNTYGLMIGHASVLQNARQTDNRKGRRKRGPLSPVYRPSSRALPFSGRAFCD